MKSKETPEIISQPGVSVGALKEFSEKHNLDGIVMFSWQTTRVEREDDDTSTSYDRLCETQTVSNVSTYGRTLEQCASAAQSGNHLKQALGWPDKLCNELPPRMTNEACDKILSGIHVTGDPKGSAIQVITDSGDTVVLTLEALRALTFKLQMALRKAK